MLKAVLSLGFALCSAGLLAASGHNHKPTMPKEFDTLKNLVGTWEGTTQMGEKEEKVTVVYELTSGGTAMTERLMPGTPHEMISVYHKSGKSLAMTHYCSLGNQPFMPLKKADGGKLAFEMKKPVGVSSMKEPHMHAVTLSMPDKNTLKQEWVHFDKGKKAQTAVFTFKRKS